jgi:hypothetical protein
MSGHAAVARQELHWLTPLPATLTQLHFARLTAARNAQLEKESTQDAACSAQKLHCPKDAGEQAESHCYDALSLRCNYDVDLVLRALRAVPNKPRVSRAWLGTEAHRRRALQRLAQQQKDEPQSVQLQLHAQEHDRTSDSGCAAAQQSADATMSPGQEPQSAATLSKSSLAYDAQEHIRKLESKVMEQRKKAERERAEKQLRDAQKSARKAKVRQFRSDHHHNGHSPCPLAARQTVHIASHSMAAGATNEGQYPHIRSKCVAEA